MQALPTLPVDPWIKFTATTVGRDKLYRTIQYVAKFVAAYLTSAYSNASTTIKPPPPPPAHIALLIERLTKLSNAIGMARKLFRIGKPIDFIQTLLKATSIQDDVIRACSMGRSLFLAGWLSLDAIQWLNAQSIIHVPTIKSINTHAARCWFFGLLFALTADVYRLRNNLLRLETIEKVGPKELATNEHLKKEYVTLKKEQSKITLELVQDGLDLLIPGSILEYVKVSPVVVGMAGTITSLIGWHAAWPRA